jgi:hypothetical protein
LFPAVRLCSPPFVFVPHRSLFPAIRRLLFVGLAPFVVPCYSSSTPHVVSTFISPYEQRLAGGVVALCDVASPCCCCPETGHIATL